MRGPHPLPRGIAEGGSWPVEMRALVLAHETVPSARVGRCLPDVNPDAATATELIEVLDRFCLGIADRDAEAVMRLCAPDADLVVITSEEPLLRGPGELRRFLDRYLEGPTTYSWQWDRHDVWTAGSVAWLLAQGTETASSDGRVEHHTYRMTMVLERRDAVWLLRLVHGSSPH